jgi:D-proline reductase (dithiol) PrdB
MARLTDLKLRYRAFMRAYRYHEADWAASVLLAKPLSGARVALVTTAAFHLPDQPAFDGKSKAGDASFREIPVGADLQALRIAHRSDAFDASGIDSDKNLALPVDRARELVSAGVLGDVAPRHYSFQGSIPDPRRLVAETAPEVARRMLADQVDVALLTPV